MLSHRRFVGYAMTGGLAAAIDLGGFLLFNAMGMAIVMAATASFLIAALVNFTSSSLLVFRTPVTWPRLARFVGVASVGLLINVGVTWLVYRTLPSALMAKIIGIGSAFIFNYIAHSFLVFRPQESKAE